MRDLGTPKSKVRAAYLDTVSTDKLQAETIKALQEKVEQYEEWLKELLVRTPEEVELEVSEILNGLSKIEDLSVLDTKVRYDYNEHFFLAEPDTNFKVRLANAVLSYMNAKFKAPYKNPLITGIANRDAEYLRFLQGF
jgi:hypothetical protein